MLVTNNFSKSLDYHIVKEFIISLGRNIPIYGFGDDRIELPGALLYRSANYLASCNCNERKGNLVERLRCLARLIRLVRKADLALKAREFDAQRQHRLWVAVDKLAGFLWACHKHHWFMVSRVTVFEDGRASVWQHHNGCWVSGRATIREALLDSLEDKATFIHVALTPYQAVFSVTHCREHLKTTRCPLHIPAVPV